MDNEIDIFDYAIAAIVLAIIAGAACAIATT